MLFITLFQRRPATVPAPAWSLGFTLLELLVVIAIIGLLAGYVAPRYFSQIGKSEVGVAKAQIDSFEKALDQYRLDTGRYRRPSKGWRRSTRSPQTSQNGAGHT